MMQHTTPARLRALIAAAVTITHSCAGCSTCGGGGSIGGRTCTACKGTGKCSHGGGR